MLSLVGDALGPKTDSHLWRDPVESDGLFGVFVPSPYEVPAGLDGFRLGDPFFPGSGEVVVEKTDLEVPSRGMAFSFTRAYRSMVDYNGPLGAKWDHSYNKRGVQGDENSLSLFMGDGRGVSFTRDGLGVLTFSPEGGAPISKHQHLE